MLDLDSKRRARAVLESRLSPNQKQALKQFCKANALVNLSFFGSILTDAFTSKSDIDIMVEFAPGRTPGYAFFGLAEKLEKILGRKVDLTTYDGLHPYIETDVLRTAQLYYEAS